MFEMVFVSATHSPNEEETENTEFSVSQGSSDATLVPLEGLKKTATTL